MKETWPVPRAAERHAKVYQFGQYVAELLKTEYDDEHLLAIRDHYEVEGIPLTSKKKKHKKAAKQKSKTIRPVEEYPHDFDQWSGDER